MAGERMAIGRSRPIVHAGNGRAHTNVGYFAPIAFALILFVADSTPPAVSADYVPFLVDTLTNRAGTSMLAGNSSWTPIPWVPKSFAAIPTPSFDNGQSACATVGYVAAMVGDVPEDRPFVSLSFDFTARPYGNYWHIGIALMGKDNPALIQNADIHMGCFADTSAASNLCRLGAREPEQAPYPPYSVSPLMAVNLTLGRKYTLTAAVARPSFTAVVTLMEKETNTIVGRINGTFPSRFLSRFGVIFGSDSAGSAVCTNNYVYSAGSAANALQVLFNDTLVGSHAGFWRSIPADLIGRAIPRLLAEGACAADAGVMALPSVTAAFGSSGASLFYSYEFMSRDVTVDAAGVTFSLTGTRTSTGESVSLRAGCEYTNLFANGVQYNCVPFVALGDDCSKRVAVYGPSPVRLPSGFVRLSLELTSGRAILKLTDISNILPADITTVATSGWESVFAQTNFNYPVIELRPSYTPNGPSGVEKCVRNVKFASSAPVQFNAAGVAWPAITPCNYNGGNPPPPDTGNGGCNNTVNTVQCLGNYLSLVDVQRNLVLLCSSASIAVGASVPFACYWMTAGTSPSFARTPDLSSGGAPLPEHVVNGANGWQYGVTRQGLFVRPSVTASWQMQALWVCPQSCSAP